MELDVLKAKLFSIWKEELGSPEWVPLIPALPREGCLLFVGLKPSFSDRGWKQVLRHRDGNAIDPRKYFAWRNQARFDPAVSVELETLAKSKHSYFTVPRAFAKATGLPRDHLDLFQYRETNQKKVRPLILRMERPLQLSRFGKRQFELAMSLIEAARPRAVVVANALASKIYGEMRDLEFSEVSGCYFDSFGGKQTPIFLSAMLTGRHALDVYSRERLRWHVCQVLGLHPLTESSDAKAIPT